MSEGPRLLIVDDEAALLGLLTRYLSRLGYRIESASTAEEALTLFEADPQGYDCVITDLTMPGMKGDELVDRMRAKSPRLRALISSGYPYEPQSKDTRFLQKPYLPDMLAKAIKDLLGKRA
jgi:CheY-like chemotaxis protein